MINKDVIIRNMLVMPANNPSMLLKSTCFKADSYIFDLEDGVSFSEKDAARRLLVKHLKTMDFTGETIIVRVNNDNPQMLEADLKAVANTGIWAVVIPKCENKEIITLVESILDKYTTGDRQLGIIPVIETGKGALNTQEIIGASDRIVAAQFGAGDYASDIGATASKTGMEFLFARSVIINACAQYGVMAIDAPCLSLENPQELREDCENSKNMGFVGKIAINPRQIEVINEVFTPSEKEINWSRKIIEALSNSDSGVISVDGKMIDIAITKKAEKVLSFARKVGII